MTFFDGISRHGKDFENVRKVCSDKSEQQIKSYWYKNMERINKMLPSKKS